MPMAACIRREQQQEQEQRHDCRASSSSPGITVITGVVIISVIDGHLLAVALSPPFHSHASLSPLNASFSLSQSGACVPLLLLCDSCSFSLSPAQTICCCSSSALSSLLRSHLHQTLYPPFFASSISPFLPTLLLLSLPLFLCDSIDQEHLIHKFLFLVITLAREQAREKERKKDSASVREEPLLQDTGGRRTARAQREKCKSC